MLANGFIRESNSPMVSPLVCVIKGKDGCNGVRLAIDYRCVNRYTVSDAFPVPDIEDIIQKIGNKHFLFSYVCVKGYHQCCVREQDKWLTEFVCLDKLYEYNRTPFGMKNAGETFIWAMQLILHPIREFAKSYVDDSAVHSDAWRSHLIHNEEFLKVMRKEGITINLNKSRFAQQAAKFCGDIVSSGRRSPDPDKVAAIKGLKVPKTKKQLRGSLASLLTLDVTYKALPTRPRF